jgi:hypothetical protein
MRRRDSERKEGRGMLTRRCTWGGRDMGVIRWGEGGGESRGGGEGLFLPSYSLPTSRTYDVLKRGRGQRNIIKFDSMLPDTRREKQQRKDSYSIPPKNPSRPATTSLNLPHSSSIICPLMSTPNESASRPPSAPAADE